jgi:CBS domain-containing protein
MTVKEFVVSHPKLSSEDLAVKARALMRKSGIRAVPIFENGKLLGIVTRSDLIKITSTKSNITAGGLIWRPVIQISPETEVRDAISLLLKSKVKQLAVFENGKYSGLVRDVDLLRAVLEKEYKPHKKTVKEVMSKPVKSFNENDSVEKVWFAIKDHSGFPVLDKKQVVGIITSNELLDSKASRISRESGGVKTPANIGSVMRIVKGEEKRFILKPDTPLEEAVIKILDTGTSVLPVVDSGLLGIVTKKDLLRGYVK